MINKVIKNDVLIQYNNKQLHDNIIILENFVNEEDINNLFYEVNNSIDSDWDQVYIKLLIAECTRKFNRSDYKNCISEGLIEEQEYFKGKTLLIKNENITKTLCNKVYSVLKNKSLIVDGFSTIHRLLNGWNMDAHIDDGGTLDNMTYSSVIYPNDNYLGGELNFIDLKIKTKPIAGSVIIFPSNLQHCVEPVIGNDTRYSCPGFVFKYSVRT